MMFKAQKAGGGGGTCPRADMAGTPSFRASPDTCMILELSSRVGIRSEDEMLPVNNFLITSCCK